MNTNQTATDRQLPLDYHADTTHVSKTMLNLFIDSPLEYYLTFVTGEMPRKQPSVAMNIGSICHAILLERKRVGAVAVAYPPICYKSNGHLNPGPAEEFRAELDGLIAVHASDLLHIERICEAAKQSELGPVLASDATFEKPLFATMECGLRIKCKPDICVELDDKVVLYDLKIGAVSHSDFMRSARRFRYWLQDAHYSRVARLIFGKPVEFRFFCQESVYPYRNKFRWYNRVDRETIADDAWGYAIGDLMRCQATGDWSDCWPDEIRMAEWEVGNRDNEVEITEELVEESDETTRSFV